LAAFVADAEIAARTTRRFHSSKRANPERDEPEYHEHLKGTVTEMADVQNPSASSDPYESANDATVRPRDYYGQLAIDAWFCKLVKGQGKVAFDPQVDNPDQRCTALTMSMLPLAEMNIRFELKRETIAESREWAGIILPSIKAAGAPSVREANGKWAKMQQVPSGRKYRAKDANGHPNGEEREATTFKVLAIYADEAACRQAYYAETGKVPDDVEEDIDMGPVAAKPAANVSMARPFVVAFAKQFNWDVAKTREACRQQPIITNAIDVDSDEFTQLVAEAMAQAA
jgi:hypothetical protein